MPMSSFEKRSKQDIYMALSKVIGLFTVANFLIFCGVAYYLGGDAINGRVEAGRYYLAMYGRTTEVSSGVFTYSKWHAYSVFVTFAVALAWHFWTRRHARQLGKASQ